MADLYDNVEQPYGSTATDEYDNVQVDQTKGYSDDTAAEMAGTALTLDLDDTFSEEKFDKAKDQLMQTGDSEYFNVTLQGVAAQELQAREDGLDQLLIDPTIDDATKDTAYLNYQIESESLAGQAYFPDLTGAQIDKFASQSNATLDEIEAIRESQEAAIGRLYSYAEGQDEEAGLFDYLGGAIPFNYNKTLFGGLARAFPEDTTFTEDAMAALLPGESVELIVEAFGRVPRSEWPERVRLLLDGMEENSGYFGTNNAILAEKAKEIADKLAGSIEVEDVDFVQAMDNIFGIADLAMVGSALKATVGGAGKYIPKTTSSVVSQADPKAATDLTAGAIHNPKVAQGAGTTQETAAYRGLAPKWEEGDELIEQGVRENLDKQLNEANQVLKDGLEELDTARFYTDDEVSQIAKGFQKSLDKMAGVKHSTENSTVGIVERNGRKEIDYQFTYTKGENEMFDSAGEALATVKARFPSANVEVREVNMGTKKVSKVVTTETSEQTVQRRIVDAIQSKLDGLMSSSLRLEDLIRMREAAKTVPTPAVRRATKKALKEAENQVKFMTEKLAKAEAVRAKSAEKLAAGQIKRAEHQATIDEVGYLKAIVDEQTTIRDNLLKDSGTQKEALQSKDAIAEMGGVEKLRTEIKRGQSRARSAKGHDELVAQLKAAKAGQYDKLTGEFAKMYKSGMKPNSMRVESEEVRYGYLAEVRGTKIPSDGDKVIFGDNAIIEGGAWKDWALDPASKFSRHIAQFASRAVDKQSAFKNKLYNLTNSFVKLKPHSQAKVTDVLIKGDEQGKVFSIAELRSSDFNLNGKEIEAYFAIRNLEDVTFMLKDHAMAKELKANDNIWIKVGEDKYAGKPVTQQTSAGRTDLEYFDPVTGGPRKFTREEMNQFYAKGGTIVELDTAITKGNRRFSRMVVDQSEGARTSAIPEYGVLNKLEGHITRFYDEKYFITTTRDGIVDGTFKKDGIVSVVRAAGSRQEAEEIVARLQEGASEGVKVNWKYDRALNAGENQMMEKQLDHSRGVLKHTGRGDRLGNLDGVAHIEDPVESIRRSTDAMARTVTTERMITDLKRRWSNTFGDLTNGQFPRDTSMMPKAEGTEAVRIEKARKMLNYINMMEGNPTGWEKGWRNAFINVAEYAEGFGKAGSNKLVQGSLDWIGQNSPEKLLRGLAFNLFIVLNPIRQFFLQSQQILFLAGLDPKAMASLPREQMGFIAGMIAKNGDEASTMWKAAAKGMGVTEAEAKRIVKAFDESGLAQSVDQHVFSRDGMMRASTRLHNGAAGKLGAALQAGVAKTLAVPRMVGFEAGEINNLMMTFLVARKRALRANPKLDILDKKTLDDLAYETRNLALSMNKAGDMPYQRGWLATGTQFLSVQHKALTTMFTNKSLTKAERTRMLAGQLALWGTSGIGLGHAYEKARDAFGLEPNEHVDNLIRAGLGEFAINQSLQALTGDDTNISVAEHYAAGSGIFNSVTDMALGALQGNISTLELVMGPSFSASNRVLDVMQSMHFATQRTDLSTVEKIREVALNFDKFSSGANNFYKIMMYKNLQSHIDKHGDPIAEATFAEVLAHGLLGLSPREVDDYYRLLNSKGGKAMADAVSTEANRLYDYWKNELMLTVDAEAELGKNASLADRQNYMVMALLEKHDTMIQHAMALYDEDMALAIQEKIRQKILSEKLGLKSDALFDKIVNNATKGTSGNSLEDVITIITNSELPEPTKQAYIQLIQESMEGIEMLKEVNNG